MKKKLWCQNKKISSSKKKVREYKYEGKDKWQQFKLELNDDIEVVGNSIKDLFARKD